MIHGEAGPKLRELVEKVYPETTKIIAWYDFESSRYVYSFIQPERPDGTVPFYEIWVTEEFLVDNDDPWSVIVKQLTTKEIADRKRKALVDYTDQADTERPS